MTDEPHREAAERFREDPQLGTHLEAHGPLALDPAEDLFRRAAVSILRQQVSTDAADAIEGRLTDAVVLSPEGLLGADESVMRDAGVSEAKVGYLRNLAATWQERGWSREFFADLDDDAVAAELTDVTGIGPWSADMFLLFGLGRPDVFPVGDLGVRKGMQTVFDDPDMTRATMRDRAERWAPHRSYASLYLWRAIE